MDIIYLAIPAGSDPSECLEDLRESFLPPQAGARLTPDSQHIAVSSVAMESLCNDLVRLGFKREELL